MEKANLAKRIEDLVEKSQTGSTTNFCQVEETLARIVADFVVGIGKASNHGREDLRHIVGDALKERMCDRISSCTCVQIGNNA